MKFLEHFASIGGAINTVDGTGLWDEADGFYYDHVRAGDRSVPLRVRSLVGLLPMIGALYAEGVFEDKMPEFSQRVRWLNEHVPSVKGRIQWTDAPGPGGRPVRKWLIALPTRERLEHMLTVMLDENELLAPYGIRSVSRRHLEHPFVLDARGQRMEVRYQPGESDSTMFGGNSNWRGPIWFPINALIVESLLTYHRFYGDTLRVEFPTGSGNRVTLREVALGLIERLVSIFRPGPDGTRPCTATSAATRPIRTSATCSCSTSTSRATPPAAAARAIKRAGLPLPWSWPTCSSSRTTARFRSRAVRSGSSGCRSPSSSAPALLGAQGRVPRSAERAAAPTCSALEDESLPSRCSS
jgi:hypothetical protein